MLTKKEINGWRAIFKTLHEEATSQGIEISMFISDYYKRDSLCSHIFFCEMQEGYTITSVDDDEQITSFYNKVINYYNITL